MNGKTLILTWFWVKAAVCVCVLFLFSMEHMLRKGFFIMYAWLKFITHFVNLNGWDSINPDPYLSCFRIPFFFFCDTGRNWLRCTRCNFLVVIKRFQIYIISKDARLLTHFYSSGYFPWRRLLNKKKSIISLKTHPLKPRQDVNRKIRMSSKRNHLEKKNLKT